MAQYPRASRPTVCLQCDRVRMSEREQTIPKTKCLGLAHAEAYIPSGAPAGESPARGKPFRCQLAGRGPGGYELQCSQTQTWRIPHISISTSERMNAIPYHNK